VAPKLSQRFQGSRTFAFLAPPLTLELLEILCIAMEEDLRSSGGTGYASTFSGFLKQCAGKTSETHCFEEPVDSGKCGSFADINVSYDYNTKYVAEQTENEAVMDINSSTETMIAFLAWDFSRGTSVLLLDPLTAFSP
jgi:hypothetical protein